MKPLDLVTLLVLGALWGSSYLFMRVAAPEFGPVTLIMVRVMVASLVLSPLLLHSGDWRSVVAMRTPIFVIGLFSAALPFCLFAFATLFLTAGYTSVINAITPLATALIAWFWLRERLGAVAVGGLILGLTGVMTLVSDQLDALAGGAGLALTAALVAAVSYGFSTNYIRLKSANLGPLELACGSQLAAMLILVLPGLWLWPEEPVSLRAWLAVLALGVGGTGVAHVLFFRLIASLGAARAITVTYLVPMFGMLFGALFLDEQVTALMMLGCGLILVGTSLATGLIRGWRSSV